MQTESHDQTAQMVKALAVCSENILYVPKLKSLQYTGQTVWILRLVWRFDFMFDRFSRDKEQVPIILVFHENIGLQINTIFSHISQFKL